MRIAEYTAQTDPGRKRRRNEDAFVAEPPLFAVADGIGGARAGEIASRLAAAAVKSERGDGSGAERVLSVIQAANRSVYERSAEDENTWGMGTTMTVALVEDDVTIGHVGDSRAYLRRGGGLEQLTDDHSLVAELVRGGKLSPEEAENHPQRSVITRALGSDPDVDVDVFTVRPERGDVFLICSDGLTDMLDDETILRVLQENAGNLEAAAKALIREANRAGGEDNITVVAFDVTDEPEERTREMAAPPEPDLDDTLTEADRVPTVEAPRVKTRRWWPLIVLLLAIVVAAVVLWFLAR